MKHCYGIVGLHFSQLPYNVFICFLTTATRNSGPIRGRTTQQGASWSAIKGSRHSRGTQCRLASDSQVLDLLMQFSSTDLEHSASSTDSSGEEAPEEQLGGSMETVLVGDDEEEEEEVVEVIVPGTPPWMTSQTQLSTTAYDTPSTSAGQSFLLSSPRSTASITDSTTARFPPSAAPRATPAITKRLSGAAAAGMSSPAKRGRKVSSYVWGHFTHTKDKFTVVCNHCRQHVRLGKEGGCARVGTTSMHRHMSVHHPLLLPKKAPSKSSADLSSALTMPPVSPETLPAVPSTTLPTVPPSTLPGAGVCLSSQLTLPETVVKEQTWAPCDPLAMERNQWLAEFLAKSMQPFSLVDEPAFREFLHRCFPQWRVPRKSYFSASAVPALAASIKEALKKELKECIGGTVHLTVDLWTSCQVQDYMSVTGHWVAHNQAGCLVRHKAALDMSGFGYIHTAGTIGQKLQSVLEDWFTPLGIKPGSITSDSAADLVKALSNGGLQHIPCAAHCLNLIVKGGLAKCNKELSTTLEMARAICDHVRNSAAAQAHLRDIQQRNNVPRHQLVWDVAARWNTTLRMLERLHEQRLAITEYFERCSDLRLNPGQWELIRDVIAVLGPFEEATRMLSLDGATLGQVLPVLRLVEVLLQDISHAARYGTPSYTVSTYLLFHFQTSRHVKAVRANIVYLTASFLDPRFRDTFHTYVAGGEGQLQRKMEEVEDHVLGEIAEVYSKEFGASEGAAEEEPPFSSRSQPGSSMSLLTTTSTRSVKDWWLRHANRIGITRPAAQQQRPQCQRSKAATVAKQELEAYRRDEVGEFCEPGSDPCKYWERKRHVWPSLYIVAVRYLACPPTSVFSERLFHTAGNVVGEGRSRLTIQNVNILCFIRMNGDWLPKDPVSGPADIFEKLCKDLEAHWGQESGEAEFSEDEGDEAPLLQKAVFEDEYCI